MSNFRKGRVEMFGKLAGILEETESGYRFSYDAGYLIEENSPSISLTLPKQSAPYESNVLFPFFDGLIPEGWLLNLSAAQWKLDRRDRMGLLLTVCEDTIGAIEIYSVTEEEDG